MRRVRFVATSATRDARNRDEFFDGVIDDVRIYARALTETEVGTDMNTAVGTPPTTVREDLRDPDALAAGFTEWSVDCPHAGLDLTWVAARPAVVHDAY